MQTINFDKLNINAGDTVLDIGCGEGRHSIGLYVDKEVNAIGIDLSMEDMKTAKNRIKDFSITETNTSSCVFGAADIKSLPFEDSVYDAVICSEVLEHVVDPVRAIEKMSKLVKPNGKIIITAPFNSLTHFSPYHYCTGFSRYFYEFLNPQHCRKERCFIKINERHMTGINNRYMLTDIGHFSNKIGFIECGVQGVSFGKCCFIILNQMNRSFLKFAIS